MNAESLNIIMQIATTILIPWAAWATWTIFDLKTKAALNDQNDTATKDLMIEIKASVDVLVKELADLNLLLAAKGIVKKIQ